LLSFQDEEGEKMPVTDKLVARSEQPVLAKVAEERRKQRRLQGQDSYSLERIALDFRVLIIEGIPGSGKDTFQAYLKKRLKGLDVYDYSEGELLHSWKHVPIDGILKLRVNFMKLFVNCVRDIVSRDKNAVFLLNRFHLSAYVTTIIRQPELGREYDEIINVLRTLPVHVFILQLDENEIKERSSHSERSSAWQKYQQQSVKKDGFCDTLEQYIWQQRLILDAAKKQQLPYSVIKFPRAPKIGGGWIHAPEAQTIFSRGVQINAADAKISSKKARSSSKFVGR
jgi:thymidylate kinase